ncbi:sulfotransferase domain-containing protein [Planctomycetes bacterium K23_9]|uniref:Sulfotransferase domain protein n=1 Tax=Stieleria marina TaxID=1930275 RepID=A0A517NSM2_9BACT|nr:Sulfotransferase domain protein [Planctomycetes bacterium K23_9]
MSPTFINIGPGRCATSWLHEILLAHPDVTMASVKETEYFNSNFHLGDKWYEDHFADEGKTASGEISNCYYTDPEVAKRIFQYNPKMKIMINVRDPHSLMQSFHQFGVRRGLPLGPLQDSLGEHIGKLMGSGYQYRQRRNQLTEGDTISLQESVLLSVRLQSFFETFPRDQIYLFVYERLKTEQEQVLAEIYDFIGVDSNYQPPAANEVVNASITPKSKSVARLATQVSYLLRRMGMYGLLSRLHKSRLVKKVFYSDTALKQSVKVNPREVLDDQDCDVLNEEIRRMIQLHPSLEPWWTRLLAESTPNLHAPTASAGT